MHRQLRFGMYRLYEVGILLESKMITDTQSHQKRQAEEKR